jgi:hypothetical protein
VLAFALALRLPSTRFAARTEPEPITL